MCESLGENGSRQRDVQFTGWVLGNAHGECGGMPKLGREMLFFWNFRNMLISPGFCGFLFLGVML